MNGAVGRDILGDAGVPLGHGEVTNVDELVDAATSAEEDLGAQEAVAGDHDIVGEDVVIADFDIVGEVGMGHEEVAVANDSVAVCLGAAVDGDVFAEGVSMANEDPGLSGGIEGEILGKPADDGTVIDDVVFTHGDATANFGLGSDAAAGADGDVFLDDGERSDFDVRGEVGGFCDEGLWVDFWH